MKKNFRLIFLVFFDAAAVAGLAGCGGKNVEPTADLSTAEESPDETDSEDGVRGAKIEGVEATVNWDDVEKVFHDHQKALYDCYSLAVEDVEEIEGRLEFAIEVGDGGRVVEVNISRSDLGSLDAEKCMITQIERFKFKLQGHGIAHFKKDISFQAPYDPAKSDFFSNQAVSKVIDDNAADANRCLGGQSGIALTLYVGRGGVVLSSGVAMSSGDLKDEAYCLAKASLRWTFPDPGLEVVKVLREF